MISYTAKELSNALNELTKKEKQSHKADNSEATKTNGRSIKLNGVTSGFLSARASYSKKASNYSIGEY